MSKGVTARYGIIRIGPENDPFDGKPPTYTVVDTPAELEQLLEQEGRRLSSTYRCPFCGTRLVETRSVILFLPRDLRDAMYCGNQLCESKGQYLPREDGTLRSLTPEEWHAMYNAGRAAGRSGSTGTG